MFNCIQIQWLGRPLMYTELIVMFRKLGQRWVLPSAKVHYHAGCSQWKIVSCGHKRMHMVCNDTQASFGIQAMIDGCQGAQYVPRKHAPKSLHYRHQPGLLTQCRMGSWIHVVNTKFWLYHLHASAENKSHQTRLHFNIFALTWGFFFCSCLTGVESTMVFLLL